MKSITFSPPWQKSDPLPVKSAAATLADPGLLADVARLGKIPIIIAEDDPISRELVSSHVKRWGFRFVAAQDGREAMEALRAEKGPAIALLDWMMPGMDGLQVCRRVRESGKTIYIILLTARGAKENVVEGLHAGADDYLVKPYDKEELFARIQVGLRILDLHTSLAQRIAELEVALDENQRLKLDITL